MLGWLGLAAERMTKAKDWRLGAVHGAFLVWSGGVRPGHVWHGRHREVVRVEELAPLGADLGARAPDGGADVR